MNYDQPPPHVLLLDHDRDEAERIAEQLREIGCRVDIAADGLRAVRRLPELRPDVLLIDLDLPSIDGCDVVRWIRAMPKLETPYIIARTHRDDSDARRRAFEAGCNEFIAKPAEVGGALWAYVERRRHRHLKRDSDRSG